MNSPFPDQIRRIALVAPAGPLDRDRFEAGLAALRGCGVTVRIGGFAAGDGSGGYLAAPVPDRVRDFEEAWLDPGVDMILCVRGGFGCSQLLDRINWNRLRQRCLPVLGYSDVTALHWAMDRLGIGRPLAGPMLGWFADPDPGSAAELAAALHSRPRRFTGLDCWRAGSAAGRPLVGNLTVAASLAGTGFLPDSTGRVIVLEEVGEPAYRVDRALTQLRLAGFFQNPAAVIFGHFTRCDGAAAVARRFASEYLHCPVLAGFPFGHEAPCVCLDFFRSLAVSAAGVAVD